MSYGQCEYVWPTARKQRCQETATVIVAGPGPGENPQKLCPEHEALVAEISLDEEEDNFQNYEEEKFAKEQAYRGMSDRQWKEAVKQNLREIRETVEACLAWMDRK